eukprot:CAMPEP_0117759904 /NCGR_PEP_ID=MMETSP0947-20121206/16283_1 /TAXON_ID=44440 /ORGANISM="Chattonella subsalsa, Strain CCMP2191" /LENGTH=842 /DNA_ID=CAMNT_0005580435 /DNA_START=71 /DNA_END=2596 /DNA_ORIENTATION=-
MQKLIKGFSHRQSQGFSIGDRVEIDWFKLGTWGENVHWEKGFVTDVYQDGTLEAIREEDLTAGKFEQQHLRHREMDPEGFVSAAGLGLMKSVRAWVEAGNVCDGFTALYLACDEGRADVVKYLVEECNAEQNYKNVYGVKAFDLAFMSVQPEIINYAIQLQIHGASVPSFKRSSRELHIDHFFSRASPFCKKLQQRAIYLIRASDFLKLKNNSFESFQACRSMGIHVACKSIRKNSKVLYISHPLKRRNTLNKKYECQSIVNSYLNEHSYIEYLWFECMCLDPDDYSDSSKKLSSTIAALFCSTHFLILPKVGKLEVFIDNNYQEASKTDRSRKHTIAQRRMSNIQDYLSQASCMLELLIAMFVGCTIHCSVQLKGIIDDFIEISSIINHSQKQIEQRARLQIQEAIRLALMRSITQDNRPLVEAVLSTVLCDLPDPLARLRDLVYSVMSISDNPNIVMKVLTGQLNSEILPSITVNLLSGPTTLDRVAKSLGKVHEEKDYTDILRGLFLVIMYSMDKLPASPMDNNPAVATSCKATRCSSFNSDFHEDKSGPIAAQNFGLATSSGPGWVKARSSTGFFVSQTEEYEQKDDDELPNGNRSQDTSRDSRGRPKIIYEINSYTCLDGKEPRVTLKRQRQQNSQKERKAVEELERQEGMTSSATSDSEPKTGQQKSPKDKQSGGNKTSATESLPSTSRSKDSSAGPAPMCTQPKDDTHTPGIPMELQRLHSMYQLGTEKLTDIQNAIERSASSEELSGFNQLSMLWDRAPMSHVNYSPPTGVEDIQPIVMDRGAPGPKYPNLKNPEVTPEQRKIKEHARNLKDIEEIFDTTSSSWYNLCCFGRRW